MVFEAAINRERSTAKVARERFANDVNFFVSFERGLCLCFEVALITKELSLTVRVPHVFMVSFSREEASMAIQDRTYAADDLLVL